MNILMIASWYKTKKWKSGGSFFTEQANGLINLGHNVYLMYCDCFAANRIGEYIHYAEEEIERHDNGLIVYRKKKFCPLKNKINGHHKEFGQGIIELYEKYFNNKIKIDIVHAQGAIWAGYAALSLKEKYGLEYVITEHATFYNKDPKSVHHNENVLNSIYRKSSYNMCVSRVLKETLESFKFPVDTIVENMVDDELFRIRKRKSNRDVFQFVSVAHILSLGVIQRKGLDLLIKCFASLEKEIPNIKLKIGGGGDALPILEDFIKKYDAKNIVLLGQLSRDEVAELFSDADCFVLPSVYETFGVVYIEALASGCPIIATNRTGLVPYVNKDNGYIIDAGNEQQLKEAMKCVYKNRCSYKPKEIRERCINSFSENVICTKLEKIYYNVISAKERNE